MSSSVERAGVVRATLSFLTIYNPTLSTSDETSEEQIVYYYSKSKASKQRPSQSKDGGEDERKEEKDERLRQVGLAQGMVSFAKIFSNGKAVDWIETEKSRIILHELETHWWLLASIDLTRLPSSSESPAYDESRRSEVLVEYSAREVCPPILVLQQILRAHQIFLLHQAPSIADLYTRIARPKFCGFLKRFWDGFVWNWDVLLNGNPAVDIFNGLKLAAGGELGIGVGEEEWGSGEREVLEGFIGRTDGLVDLVVSRFGDAPDPRERQSSSSSLVPNVQDLNSRFREYPKPSDGIVFSGIGALTRSSVRTISSWMEWLRSDEHNAYGVRENPSSVPRRKHRKISPSTGPFVDGGVDRMQREGELPKTLKDVADVPGIPPPIVGPNKTLPAAPSELNRGTASTNGKQNDKDTVAGDPNSSTETLMKYLTLGVYGSSWGIPYGRPPVNQRVSSLHNEENSQLPGSKAQSKNMESAQPIDTHGGFFLIGLRGELDEDLQTQDFSSGTRDGTDIVDAFEERGLNDRITMRTLHVERAKRKPSGTPNESTILQHEVLETYHDRLRVVVYVQKPFIFTFLFELQTDALAIPSFYRSLHHQLGPLQRPLLNSTSPSKVSDRLWEAVAPKSTASTTSDQPVYDLVYDPVRLTVHTTIPNIPGPGHTTTTPTITNNPTSTSPAWTRVEALSVHSQILNTYISTRRNTAELERTCKTGRGWWVVWMRLPQTPLKPDDPTTDTQAGSFREAFLIRRASDYVPPAARKASGRLGGRDLSGATGSGAGGGWGPGKLAEGIGIDARQYIEGLLSLNR